MPQNIPNLRAYLQQEGVSAEAMETTSVGWMRDFVSGFPRDPVARTLLTEFKLDEYPREWTISQLLTALEAKA